MNDFARRRTRQTGQDAQQRRLCHPRVRHSHLLPRPQPHLPQLPVGNHHRRYPRLVPQLLLLQPLHLGAPVAHLLLQLLHQRHLLPRRPQPPHAERLQRLAHHPHRLLPHPLPEVPDALVQVAQLRHALAQRRRRRGSTCQAPECSARTPHLCRDPSPSGTLRDANHT